MVAYNFKKQFAPAIQSGEKTHTIRRFGKRHHAREGDRLQLYMGMRTKSCAKILTDDPKCLACYPITFWIRENQTLTISVLVGGVSHGLDDIDLFARDDGFANAEAMHAFWVDFHGFGVFTGALIDWGGFEPGRYQIGAHDG